MKRFVPLFILCLLVCEASILYADEKEGPKGKKPVELVADRPIKVLFCGNSYTSIGSGLPAQLNHVVKLKGSKLRIEWDRWTAGGSTIAQRWNTNLQERMESLKKHDRENPKKREVKLTLPDTLKKNEYDFLILQQHSRGRAIVSESAPVIQLATARKIRVVYFLTWSGRKEMGPKFPKQAALTDAYSKAQQKYKTGLVPCGPLWQAIKTEMPKLKIYRDPGHPSDLGHHVNALMFYMWLTGHDVRKLSSANLKGLNTSDEKQLRELVVKTYHKYAIYGR